MRRHAAIIGGGIGGLATAIALGNDGWRVTVHERDSALPITGTALGMWPAALRALDALKTGHAVRETGTRQESGEVRRPDGSRIVTIRTPAADPIHLISRPALLKILHGTATTIADLRFSDPVDRIDSLDADLVVVADGVFSRTREQLFGSGYRARYSGGTAWRGTVDGMATSTFVEVWGCGVKFGVTPQEGGRTNWFAAGGAPEGDFHPGAEAAALRRMFGGWAAPVSQVLDTVTEGGILRHDVYVTPPLPTYVSGNAALIGDAAHAMTPDLGRGACEALIDAVALADCLRETTAIPVGLAAYDRRRRPATRRLARMAAAAGHLSRVRRALPMRDGLLRASMLAGPPA
ncbi:FAD-dependent monooxygenase [Actinoplanes sichuanensis]|uniref:FAD-dependent monooxygenase n=1 Tax=Actinoplanes sichuanensis TaxID=512349 RepID=A0ABW4A8C0_9ACTN|nr:FAD-dependent monooxygenase [Actinoplanes sichuanensis]BEL03430.1 FAD-dependent monooxygenase [Actinoplanes sichuanensis]